MIDTRYFNRNGPTLNVKVWWNQIGWSREDHRKDDGSPHFSDWWFKTEPIEDEI